MLYSDSTHLKANANKRKLIEQEVTLSVEDLGKYVEEDRKLHGKKPLKKRP